MVNMNNENKNVSIRHIAHPLMSASVERFVAKPGTTIAEMLSEINYPIQNVDGVMVWLNGVPVEDFDKVCIRSGDVVNVRPIVKGDNVGSILATIATIVISIYFPPAAAAAGFGKMASAFITAGAIFAATKLIYSAFPPPKPQDYAKKESYLLAGTQNRQRQYEPMPVVIGEMRVAPDSMNMPYGTFEDNDQYVYQVFNFGLQKNLEISDYEIAGTKVGDFSEPPTITRADSLGNLPAEFNDVEVIQGGEVRNDAGPLVKTTSKGAIRIDIDLQVVAYDVKDDGGISTKGISVEIRVFNSSDGSLVYETSSVYSGDGVNENRHTIPGQDLPAGTYRVEITKASGDLNDSKKQRNLNVVAIKAFQEDNTDYSNYTRIGVKMKASNQLSGSINELTALVHAKIPVFDGVSWNISKTSNPAWWLLYWARGLRSTTGQILFGAGLGDHQINMEQIKRFALFCDRKKLSCNLWHAREATVKQVADVIARCGRGEYTWGTGKFGAIFDDDQLSEIAVFGPSNVRAGSFKVNYNADQTADEVIVNYLNEDDHYNADSVRVNVGNTQTPERPIQFQFEGCTNTDMAGREARMIAAAQELMRRTVNWETDIEGVFLKRGDVVRLSHDMVGWSQSGRVRAAGDRKTFFIDKEINFTSAGYIGIRTPDGKYETFKIAKVEGLKVTLKTEPPLNFKMPGEINTTSLDWLWFYDEGGKPGKLVKITDIQPKDVHTLSFTAKDYLEEYYQSETGDFVHVEKPDISTPVNSIIPGVLAWESYRVSGENKILVLALSWIPLSTVNNYTVRIWNSQVGGEQQSTTSNSGIRFDVTPGTYNYRISGTDSITGAIYSAVGTITITGSATVNPLSEVEANGILGAIVVSWKYPDNALNLRKVDIVARWNALDGSQSFVRTFSEPFPINTLTHSGLEVAQRVDYELTLVDAEGNKSSAVNVFGITSDNIDQIIDAVEGQLSESALDQSLKDQIDKIDQNELLLNGYIGTNDAALEKIRGDLNTAKNEASQGIADANKEINDVNSTLTGAVNNANTEIDQVKQDLANAVAQEQENNAQLKKELEALIAVAGVTTYSQPDQPATGKEGDIWFKEDAQGNVVDVYRFHNGAWELSSHADIEANAAAIINEQTVRASADEALGNRIDALVVKTGANEAAISQEATARANADSAISQLVNQVKATTDKNTAAIKTEETARTDADTALASRIDSLSTTVGKNTADITSEQTVRANADTALSQRIDRVSSKADKNEAAISSEATTRASADGALSMRIDSVTAKAGANESAIQSEITARTDADSALSSRIDSVTAKTAQNDAAIKAEATARADADKAFATQVDSVSSSISVLYENESGVVSNDTLYNGNFKIRNEDSRPAGWYAAYHNTDKTTIGYSPVVENNALLNSATKESIGMASTAFAVNQGSQYKLRAKIKAQKASPSGSFVRIYELDDDMPLGGVAISEAGGVSGVVPPSSSVRGIREDAPIGEQWEIVDYTYTPTKGAKFASIVLLNWAGMGVNNALYIEFVSVVEIPAKAYIDAEITTVKETITTETQSLSKRIDSVSSTVNNKADNAKVEALTNRVSQAETDISGKASASEVTTLKSSVGDLFANESGVVSNDTLYNGNFKIRNEDSRPAGWYAAYYNTDKTTIGYSPVVENNALLNSATKESIGMASTAFAVNQGSKYKLRVKIKAQKASPSGSFVRIYELDDDMPLGGVAISEAGGVSGVVPPSSSVRGIREDAPIGEQWEIVDYTYTPTKGAKFASIVLLNWAGMGVNNALYIEFVSVVEIPAKAYVDSQLTIVNQTIANTEQSLTQQVTQLESEFNGKTAAIQQELTTTVNKVGEVESKYSVKVDNNGYVSGFGLISTENNGVPTSEFAVRADKFFIAAPAGSNYDGGDNKYPFIVQNGKVYMRNAVIQNGAIDSAKIANVIQSTNYVPGKSGWKLPKNGAAEFNSDVIVNAQIQANSIVGDIVSAKSKQGQTVSQSVIERDTPLFGSIEISTARPFDRTLIIRVGLRVAAKTAEGGSDLHPCSGLVKCTSSQYGQRVSFVQSVYSLRGTHLYYNTLDSIAEVIYDIPANTKGTINIYGRKLVRQGGAGGESYVRVFPIDGNPESSSATGKFIAQLFKNGADLV